MSRLSEPDRWTRAKSWLDAFLGFFYPEVCQYCGAERATAPEGFIGAHCQRHVTAISRPMCERCGLPFDGHLSGPFACPNCRDRELAFESARSAVVARGMVLDLLHQYKYRGALWVEPFLASLLIRAARPALQQGGWDMIVPVPLHPAKQRRREFNQAARLARRLGRVCGLPVAENLLRRQRDTDSQTRLSRAARLDNVHKAFELRHDTPIRDRRIVLIDDVLTTGATTSACAQLLTHARARAVCVWTVARGLLS